MTIPIQDTLSNVDTNTDTDTHLKILTDTDTGMKTHADTNTDTVNISVLNHLLFESHLHM